MVAKIPDALNISISWLWAIYVAVWIWIAAALIILSRTILIERLIMYYETKSQNPVIALLTIFAFALLIAFWAFILVKLIL